MAVDYNLKFVLTNEDTCDIVICICNLHLKYACILLISYLSNFSYILICLKPITITPKLILKCVSLHIPCLFFEIKQFIHCKLILFWLCQTSTSGYPVV